MHSFSSIMLFNYVWSISGRQFMTLKLHLTELIFVNSLLLPPLFKLGTPTKAFGSHKTLSHFIWPPISLCNQFKSNRLVLLHPTLIKKLSQIKWPILNIFSDRNKFCPSKLQQTILYFSLSGRKIQMGCYLQTQNYLLIYSKLIA